MADTFYKTVVLLGRFPFWVSSSPIVLHADRVPHSGPFLLASSHLSPFDVPLLMRHTPRVLDFVSIVEVFNKPFVGWFFGKMGAFALDRSRKDPKTAKTIVDRLTRGRAVVMFPEGRIKSENDSVICGARFRPGTARLARLANVPIVPVVVYGSTLYSNPASWLPVRRTRYGVIYGEAIDSTNEERAEQMLAEAYRALFEELRAAMTKA